VFPDAAPLHLARVLAAVEQAGLVTQHVEGLANDYIETLNRWIARFDQHLERAVELAGAERVRVFRLYLRAARNGFRVGFTGVYQVLARRPEPDAGPSF
jgi:cyclopropane-fatty-acyl-phospholipid synthase